VAKLTPYGQLKFVQERDAEISAGKKGRTKPKAGDPPKNLPRGLIRKPNQSGDRQSRRFRESLGSRREEKVNPRHRDTPVRFLGGSIPMGAVTTEQQKLVLNSFAMVLQNNLVTADAVSWNEYDGEMDDRNGLQVLEQITPRYNVTRTENGVKDLSAGTDGTVFGSELFEVTGTFNANMGWGDFVKIKSIGDARESKALLGAATSMAEKIDAYILSKAVLASADWTGDGATSINEWIDAAAGYARLKENGVDDSELSFIFNHTDEMKLGDQVVKLPAPDAFTTSTFRKGFSGELAASARCSRTSFRF
jgi:hypothetical protein